MERQAKIQALSATITWQQKLNLELNFETQSSLGKNFEALKSIFASICNEKDFKTKISGIFMTPVYVVCRSKVPRTAE